MLQDGQNLRLSFRDIGGLATSDIEQWSAGRQLLVIYNSEEGAALLDPETLKRLMDGRATLTIEKSRTGITWALASTTRIQLLGDVRFIKKCAFPF